MSRTFRAHDLEDAAERLDAVDEPAETGRLVLALDARAADAVVADVTVSDPFSSTTWSHTPDARACLTVFVTASAQT